MKNIPKVLIVDDQKDIRLFIKLFLGKENKYEFYEAVNGKEAIEIATEVLPHIILMDAIMPVMDGFEAINILRKNELTSNIPILMISSLDSHDEKVKALKSGISDFISKPFDQVELSIRVNSLLNLYMKFLAEEEKLREINADLEAKVNQKLEKRLTDIRLASIGQMASGITHELNTPVTYMRGIMEFFQLDTDECEDIKELKTIIHNNIEMLNSGLGRIKGIIDTTRELSKKSDNKRKMVNVYETLVITSRMVYARAKHLSPIFLNGEKFDMGLKIDHEIFNAEIFRQKLEQVWIIILNNACDEFEESTLEFEDRRIDINIFQEDDKTSVIFKDNAKGGIDENILPKIFEAFTSSKENSGVGIGLNIAHEIVELHNGEIKAYNKDGFAVFEVVI